MMTSLFLGSLLLHLISRPVQEIVDSNAKDIEDNIGPQEKLASALLLVAVESGRFQGLSSTEEPKAGFSETVFSLFLLGCSSVCLGLSLATLFVFKTGELLTSLVHRPPSLSRCLIALADHLWTFSSPFSASPAFLFFLPFEPLDRLPASVS